MTSRTRKLTVGVGAVAIVIVAWSLWPQPKGYTYQGKTVEEWFMEYTPVRYGNPDNGVAAVFVQMGTNAVPFLVAQVNQDLTPLFFEPWTRSLPEPLRLNSKVSQAYKAAWLLCEMRIRKGLLRELLQPALVSTNGNNSIAEIALSWYEPNDRIRGVIYSVEEP